MGKGQNVSVKPYRDLKAGKSNCEYTLRLEVTDLYCESTLRFGGSKT